MTFLLPLPSWLFKLPNVAVMETTYQMLEVLSLAIGRGLISFNKDRSDINDRSFPGCLFFENIRKNFHLNLVLEVVLELESEGNTRNSFSGKYSSHAQIK